MMHFIEQFVPTPLVATTRAYIAVVMVTDTVLILGIYWTRRHYRLVTRQCVGTNWFTDPFRAAKIKFLILLVLLKNFLVFGSFQLTPDLSLLIPNLGTR
jgi:hypothetical protein